MFSRMHETLDVCKSDSLCAGVFSCSGSVCMYERLLVMLLTRTTTLTSTSVAAPNANAAKIIPAAIFLRGLKDRQSTRGQHFITLWIRAVISPSLITDCLITYISPSVVTLKNMNESSFKELWAVLHVLLGFLSWGVSVGHHCEVTWGLISHFNRLSKCSFLP